MIFKCILYLIKLQLYYKNCIFNVIILSSLFFPATVQFFDVNVQTTPQQLKNFQLLIFVVVVVPPVKIRILIQY